MDWIDYRKVYDMNPHSWIIEYLDLFWSCEERNVFLEEKFGGLEK